MSYIGNSSTQQAFSPAVDYFNGTGAQTAFTLSRPVASVAQIQVVVNNVEQNPSSAFSVSGNTLTFTSAPSTGSNNIYVYYTSPITQTIAPGQGTVGTTQLAATTGSGAVVLSAGPTISGAVVSAMASSVLTSGTAVASTSGTSIDFTGIPSWVKRITVTFNGVSTNGSANYWLQLGSGSVSTIGYNGVSAIVSTGGAATTGTVITTAFAVNYLGGATTSVYGTMVLTLVSGNTWVCNGGSGDPVATRTTTTYGGITLGGALDRVRITTSNGTDTFDAGSINILYE